MGSALADLVSRVQNDGVPDRYIERPDVTRTDLEEALETAIGRIERNLDQFHDQFPRPSSTDLQYEPTDNTDGWTTAFWTGQCWLAYEVTGEEKFKDAAEAQLETFDRRLSDGVVTTHDLGFLYTLSAVAGHRVTGSDRYRRIAVRAADLLAERFWPNPGILQAWGDPETPDERPWAHGRIIVDTMMNLPLLFWASDAGHDERYADIAREHARTTANHIVREDGSTYHTFQFDVETGDALGGETHQGYADDSCWARGQAWAVYGYALASEYETRGEYAELAARLANYYLHRVEDDHVPRWDFDAPADDHALDTSAAAIAACGLDQLATELPSADRRKAPYRYAALAILSSLATNYAAGTDSNGLLTDAAYNRPEGDYDECCIWGDYFYLEGLVRATNHWDRYW